MSSVCIFSIARRESQEGIEYFDTWEAFEGSKIEASGFWIDRTWSGNIGTLVDSIRRSAFWDRLVFTEEAQEHPAIDGQCPLDLARARIARAELAKQGLHIDFSSLIPVEKLLLYMYVRDEYELVPHFRPDAKSLYVYPIADYLGSGETTMDWITRLMRTQLLSPVRLINRIRMCKECGSGHLSFVDVCPSCASIEIKHTPSLHCFTCGHTSRKGDFELEGTLVCPKCQARLRHIGVDYDLPTAQYACRKCNSFAMEARIVAHCLDCDAKSEPEQLDVQEVYSLALSSRGMEALRQGQFHESFSVTGEGNHVIPAYFRQILHWSSVTHQRYSGMRFGVMMVEFANVSELLAQLGAARVYAMMNEYTLRLRQVLRASDVTSVDSAERLWIFLPFSSPEDIAVRLQQKADEWQPENAHPFKLHIRCLFAPRDVALGESADNIMQALLER
ncbi:MAG TPA: hypothetical protein VIG66_04530 [Noviherbaspirillum sp.]